MITTRSSRTFFEALHRARLTPPTSRDEIGERYLDLLVAGVDFELVGFDPWYLLILSYAPNVVARHEAD
jgi:hypothetical protein